VSLRSPSSPDATPSREWRRRALHRARRGFLSGLLGGCCAAGLFAGEDLGQATLQLKWRHQFQFAGYYAAKEKGFYREAGLEVNIREASAAIDPIQEVLASRAQYGVGNSGLLLARQAGAPVVVLAAIFQHSPLLLIARGDAGVDSIHDLAGRRIMLEPHAEELLAYLRKEGIPASSIHPIPHNFDVVDLIQGKVDALSAYSSDETFLLEQAGFQYLTFTPRSVGIDFYGDNLFTSESELRTHPARVKAFREASLRGWKYAMQHPDEIIDFIHARYGTWHSKEHLAFEARQMVPLLRPELVEMGYMSEGRWKHIADTYRDLGLLSGRDTLSGFLYDAGAAEKVAMSRLQVALALVLPLVGLLGGLFLIYFGLNRRLRRAVRAEAETNAGLRESEQRFRFIAEHSADVIWTLDLAAERFTYVSPGVFRLLGWSPEEILLKPPASLLSPESAAILRASLAKAIAEWKAGRPVTPQVTEVEQRHREGHPVPTEVVTTLHGDAEGRLVSVLGVSRDITERRRAEAQLRQEFHSMERLATRDPLTGVWNRRCFEDAIGGEMGRSQRHGHPLSLLMLDLDHFKDINDAAGHAAGDQVLRGVADGLRGALRTSDSITRWGGEEFLILMPNTGLASATILAERIREALATRPFEGIGRVTASLGLSEFIPPESLEAWVERTDQAMFRAKGEGRNRVAVDPRRRESPEPSEGALQLVWKEDYRSGHPAIDAQHEHLFHRANQLLDAILTQRPKEDVADLVAQIFAVARQHFQDEEAILAAQGFPGLAHHAECHAAMIRRAQELSQAYLSGTLPVGDIFQFLAQEVVAGHLLKEDREFFHLVGRR